MIFILKALFQHPEVRQAPCLHDDAPCDGNLYAEETVPFAVLSRTSLEEAGQSFDLGRIRLFKHAFRKDVHGSKLLLISERRNRTGAPGPPFRLNRIPTVVRVNCRGVLGFNCYPHKIPVENKVGFFGRYCPFQ